MYKVYVNNIYKQYWICSICCRNNPPVSTIVQKPTQNYNSTTGNFYKSPGVSTSEDN